jgi:hypothetical protein
MAYGVYARREAADLLSQIQRRTIFYSCFKVLRWSEPVLWRRRRVEISINKAASARSGGQDQRCNLFSLIRHGGVTGEGMRLLLGCPLDLQQGRGVASHRRLHTAPLSPFFMAGRRPLQPRVMASGRHFEVFFWRYPTAPLSLFYMAEGRPLQP